MRKVLRVFLSDVKRLSSNVVAIVIIMGLCIIPALYAWFNIMSNWDPYGQEATSQMKIAVYSEDQGYTLGDYTFNLGDTVVDGLKSNDTVGWVFSEDEDSALEGVYSGDYYAAFIIPEDFTESLMEILNGEIKNPTITYYQNDKKNAIAAKITSKVKTTVQNQVNTSIVEKLTEIATQSGEILTDDGEDGYNLLDNMIARLEDMDSDLVTYVSILDTLSILTDSTSQLVDSTQTLIPSAESVIDSSQDTITSMQGAVLNGASTASTISSMVNVSLDSVSDALSSLSSTVKNLDTDVDVTTLIASIETADQTIGSVLTVMGDMEVISESEDFQTALSQYETLSNDLETLEADATKTEGDISALQATLTTEISNCQKSVDQLQDTFTYDISPNLSNAVLNAEVSLVTAQKVLSSMDDNFPEISASLSAYSTTLSQGSANIATTRDQVSAVEETLGKLITALDNLSQDQRYEELMEIFSSDPELLAEFVSSPIQMNETAVYEIENYGSAMAPFYCVLALWVGALILVALVHVKVKDQPEIADCGNVAKFFGRYIFFFLMGQTQTMITVLGCLFYIRIQCPHPFLFWLASAVISATFTMLIYALTVAFGSVGEGAAVVIMVIQVAGSGGTFPVEVLPLAYRMIYRFLPFTYAMRALRECIGGFYHMDYGVDLAILAAFFVISVVIGLVIAIPFRGLLRKVETSMEKSKLMLG